MVDSINRGSAGRPPSIPPEVLRDRGAQRRMKWGDSALTAPTSPSKRLPQVDRNRVDPKVIEAARGFEEVFLDQMVQSMRKTVPKNELEMDSNATQIYQGMLDSEFSNIAAASGGVGIQDLIIAYLGAQSYNETQGSQHGDVATKPGTGGTYEGKSEF